MPRGFKDVQPVLAYAVAHLEDDISLKALAARAGMSRFHLHRMFSAIAGETPKQLTLRLRLGRAAAMLLTTEDTVLNVALSCGFQSHEAFCRAFRGRFKISPRAYRERGLIGCAGSVQARDHAQIVKIIGPCVGFYHMSEEVNSKEAEMPYVIEQKELSPQSVLVARRRVKRSEIASTIAAALPAVFQFAQEHGIALAGVPLTRYVEMGPGLVTMEPGMRIASSAQAPDKIDHARTQNSGEATVIVETLPGGPVAMTTHMGPYDKLQDAFGAIEQWMEREGHVASGAPWESYVTDPSEHPDPKDWKTEVFWPLATGSVTE